MTLLEEVHQELELLKSNIESLDHTRVKLEEMRAMSSQLFELADRIIQHQHELTDNIESQSKQLISDNRNQLDTTSQEFAKQVEEGAKSLAAIMETIESLTDRLDAQMKKLEEVDFSAQFTLIENLMEKYSSEQLARHKQLFYLLLAILAGVVMAVVLQFVV